MLKRLNRWSLVLICATVMVGTIGLTQVVHPATAGPEIVGNPNSPDRLIVAPAANTKTKRIVYFNAGVKTMAGANTPVASNPTCGLGDFTLYRADVELVGTMAGTAPTLAIKWQHSIDGGVNWKDVGTWTTINSTVTPASQSQVVADIVGSTAVVYGDCWRATYTMGGTGTVTANISIKGIAK